MNLMRCSISERVIDIQKLDKAIFEYKYSIATEHYKPYLFVNKDTLDQLIKRFGYSLDGLCGSSNKDMCGHYDGCKIFCDNTLQFGEIELR